MARAFSTWLYGRDDILKRTPLSGGWGSGKLGDITMDPYKAGELKLSLPKIYVECKNREGLMDETFWRWFATGKPSTITDVIKDTIKKAKDFPWFVILKGRATAPFVLMLEPHGGYDVDGAIYLQFKDSLGESFGPWLFFPLSMLKNVLDENAKLKETILG